MSHTKIKRTVAFAEQAMRNARASSELPRRFMVSSPFRLWRSSEPGDPTLSERFVTLRRRATRRPHFLQSRQKMFRRGDAARNAARCHGELPGYKHILGRALHGGHVLSLRAHEVVHGRSNSSAG